MAEIDEVDVGHRFMRSQTLGRPPAFGGRAAEAQTTKSWGDDACGIYAPGYYI